MRIIPIFFAAYITLVACENAQQEHSLEVEQTVQVMTNSLDAMPVPTAIAIDTDDDLKEPINSKKESVRKLRNQKPKRSLELIAQSIEALDSSASDYVLYEEYGDALLEANRYNDAYEAYSKSKQSGNEDLGNLYFKMAKANGLNGKNTISLLHRSARKGFKNYRAYLYDPAFKKTRARTAEFMHFYSMYFSSNAKAMYKALKILAPKSTLSKAYTLDVKSLLGISKKVYNNIYEKRSASKKMRLMGDYSFLAKEFKKAAFTRSGEGHYTCELFVEQHEHYDLLICRSSTWGEYVHPETYYLITCDKKGKKIDALKIAKKGSLKTCQTAQLNSDGSLVITNNRLQFKKHAIKEKEETNEHLDYDDLASTEVIHEEMYQIQANGKIINASGILLGMN